MTQAIAPLLPQRPAPTVTQAITPLLPAPTVTQAITPLLHQYPAPTVTQTPTGGRLPSSAINKGVLRAVTEVVKDYTDLL